MAIWQSFKDWLARALRASARAGRFEAPRQVFTSLFLPSSRAYRTYLPAAASGRDRLPLLVMLHGCKQDPQIFAEGTRMNQLAEQHGYIVVYPEQSWRANPMKCWNWFTPQVLGGHADTAAIVDIVRQVAKRHRVDRSRVYLAGLSAGGAMASVLARLHGKLFAGCAVHSGLMYGAASSLSEAATAMSGLPVPPAQPPAQAAVFVPTLVIHGDSDNRVNPANAGRIVEQVKAIAEQDGSTPRALEEAPARRHASSGYAYRVRDYARNGGVVLREIIVEGLGHAWSGGDDRHPYNDPRGPDASRLILEFLEGLRRAPDGKNAESAPAPTFWSRLLARFRGRPTGPRPR